MLDTWLSKYDPTQEFATQQPPGQVLATVARNEVVMVPWASVEKDGLLIWHVSCASVRLVHALQKPFEPQSGSLDEHVESELAGK